MRQSCRMGNGLVGVGCVFVSLAQRRCGNPDEQATACLPLTERLYDRANKPRRPDVRRSWEYAFVHRKNRHSFRRTVVATAPGAGGVSPPWFRKRAYRCVSSTLPTTLAPPHPRRADAWRCCSAVRQLEDVLVLCGTTFVLPSQGGLTGDDLLVRQSLFAEDCPMCIASRFS
jgi:hypothetical protein